TESLYDKPMLQQSLEKSGFTIQKMIFTGMGGINLSIGTPTLVFPGCTITKDSFTLLINPFIMAEIVSLMPEDTIAYTELLMAPLISGEKISAEEYKMLIASMYGETLADELEKSTVTILFKSPKNIATATTEPSICKSIKITKNEVEYSLSTLDFLSLFSGIKFRIQWKL
ncbi:MAG TPA: hypothetical protein VFC68_02625, partial [Treponemataceae bacterium]|nr:hypothetical protein [Treponemataceae bacterium]